MPANNTTHDRTSIHSQQKEKKQRKWKSFTFPPPVLLKARTHNSTKKNEEKPTKTLKITHLQRFAPLSSNKQRPQ
jgi:hypothetical protein